MKKIIFAFLLTFFYLVIINTKSYCADLTAGATSWYTWWEIDEDNSSNDKTLEPALLYGPALSFKLNDDYNFSFIFLYGKFDMTETENGYEREMVISRMDSDLALNYRINSYLKIFAGGKYMSYKMTDIDFHHTAYGPGVGINTVLPIGGDFYILGIFSGAYLWGDQKDPSGSSSKYNEYGTNISLAAAYYIAPASVTLSLGGRYQYFKSVYDNPDNGDMNHNFYGITASATYTFSL